MTARGIAISVPTHLIQGIRLYQALMESSFDVHVAPSEASKFQYLQQYFSFGFSVSEGGVPLLAGVKLSHSRPRTSIGRLARPLVFPRQLVERCRSLWSAERRHWLQFRGLLTAKRVRVLGPWLDRLGAGAAALSETQGIDDAGRRIRGSRTIDCPTTSRPIDGRTRRPKQTSRSRSLG